MARTHSSNIMSLRNLIFPTNCCHLPVGEGTILDTVIKTDNKNLTDDFLFSLRFSPDKSDLNMAVKTAKSSGLKYKTISAVSVTAIAVLFLVIVSLVLINTFASRRLQRDYGRPSEASASFKLDENRSRLRAERLAKSLTIPTISWEQGHQETQALLDLHKHLRESTFL